MKARIKIIYKTILYTSPVWLFYFYMEYRLSALENSYSYKIRNFSAMQDHCEILVLGNSQMLKGIDPDFLPGPAFNMAHVSQTLPVDEAFVKKYISQLPKLKTVLIGIGYTSFGEDLETGDENWRLSFYQKYYGIEVKAKSDLKDYSNMLRYTPYEAMKIGAKNFDVDLIKGIQRNGWMKMDGLDTAKLTDDWANERARIHTKCLDQKYLDKNVEALRNIIALLKGKNIRIKIIVPPVMRNYYKELNISWMLANDNILKLIGKEYGVEIINFADQNEAFYEGFSGCFNDVDHLNETGAKKLTTIIRERIIENGKWKMGNGK